MIRVAVDGRRLQDQPPGGVGRILRCLLPHLVAGAGVTLLTDRRRAAPAFEGAAPAVRPLPGFGPSPEAAWLHAGVAAWLLRHRGTVFHGTFNAVPFATANPTVVSIYDLAWIHHPEDLGRKTGWFAVQARWAARHAGVVLAPSRFTAEALAAEYGIGPDRLAVHPVGPPPGFGPGQAGTAGALLRSRGVEAPYVVAVGGASRRALPVAVEAWRQATAGGGPGAARLVVVGPEPPPPGPGVVYLGPLDDAMWAGVLAGAEALCYPTRYEGFGLPALEAAASGTPVVAAPVAALPEVLGDAAEWAAGPGAAEMAAALGRVLGDERRRAELARRGLDRVAVLPGWDRAAAVVLDAYRRAAG
ncbi:MAG TPA: glycosyltransferase [Acidimicrobiales bacterium]|nr:glycosyltransferase [Acidimicrobiales bacterium]